MNTMLVILTVFIGAWDCSTKNPQNLCDTLLTYHLQETKTKTLSFGWLSQNECEMGSTNTSKCWKLGMGVSYFCVALGGFFYAVYGMLATLQKIFNWKTQIFNFLLAVRISHWIYFISIAMWLISTGAIAHFWKLGWCPYILVANSIIFGSFISIHLKVWNTRIDKARLVNELLSSK